MMGETRARREKTVLKIEEREELEEKRKPEVGRLADCRACRRLAAPLFIASHSGAASPARYPGVNMARVFYLLSYQGLSRVLPDRT